MIYIHIPFCRSFCTYCGFYSEAVPEIGCRRGGSSGRERLSRYVGMVCSEAESRASEIRATLPSASHPEYVDTLYVGGGTPSVLPPDLFSALVTGVNNAVWGVPEHGYSEFTVEVNPDDINSKGADYVTALLDMGVTRFSMGVQSFDDNALRWMNRRHTSEEAVKAFEILRSAGAGDISIDLIFGYATLTEELWERTLEKALALAPEHISAYQLSIDPGSMLARRSGGTDGEAMAGEEQCARQYEQLCAMLRSAGYHHYEVSNFAVPGYEARHNSAYWRRVPYAGLGAGAHSALAGEAGEVTARKWNTEDAEGYVLDGEEILTDEDVRVERVMLGLRTDRGVVPELLPEGPARRLVDEGALEHCGGRLRIPENRFFVSDEIIAELLAS